MARAAREKILMKIWRWGRDREKEENLIIILIIVIAFQGIFLG